MPPNPVESPLLTLAPDEVHVWIVEPERITDPMLLEAYRAVLDGEEREKQRRFHFERHRQQYLVSHALVRMTLSRYAPVRPVEWTFTKNAYGCPAVSGPGNTRLRFNLSHTDGMAVCAVMWDADVGVDVEDAWRRGETVEIADRFFAPTEVAALRALPLERQKERFFEYWTLKEAYIKARGMGLSLPLEQFAYVLHSGQEPRITFDPRLRDEPTAWRFFQHRPSERHQAALAVRWPREKPLRVQWRPAPRVHL